MGKERRWAELKRWNQNKTKKVFVRQKKHVLLRNSIWYMEKECTGAEDDDPNGEKLGERESSARFFHLINLAARAMLTKLIILQQTFCILFRHFFFQKIKTHLGIEINPEKLGRCECVCFLCMGGEQPRLSRSLIILLSKHKWRKIYFIIGSARDMWVCYVSLRISFTYICFH